MARVRSQRTTDIWPGFVDALSTLLLVIIFLLVVFVLAQFFLSHALSGRDAALERLNQQVTELADLLSLERQANADLRLNVAQLSASLQESTVARDELILKLDAMSRRAEDAEQALADAQAAIEADKETIKARLSEIESLKRDINALRELRVKLESDIAAMVAALETAEEEKAGLQSSLTESESRVTEISETLDASRAEITQLLARLKERDEQIAAGEAKRAELEASLAETSTQIGALRDRTKELLDKLANEEERTLLAQKDIEERDVRLSELQTLYLESEDKLSAEKEISAAANRQVDLLNQQIKALRDQLSRIEAALEVAEKKDEEQKAVIADLGKRLNRALASKVEELSRYRSEFFGRLRNLLGQRRDIAIVGDRFVFQSEVLFASGSATINPDGTKQLDHLAGALLKIAADIPDDLNWILRIDGHTDVLPIRTAQFPSNWELSAARAISVAKYLIAQGVPADRIAAAGFAQYQPLDDRQDEIAFRRNRRIEFKLTQR
jgi:chemotaxis protein MotB